MLIPSPLQPGCIVEFLQDNQPVTAWVLDIQGPRLRVFTIGQREMKLPATINLKNMKLKLHNYTYYLKLIMKMKLTKIKSLIDAT